MLCVCMLCNIVRQLMYIMLCVCVLYKARMHTCTVRMFVYTTFFGICKFVCMCVCMNDVYNLLSILNYVY